MEQGLAFAICGISFLPLTTASSWTSMHLRLEIDKYESLSRKEPHEENCQAF